MEEKRYEDQGESFVMTDAPQPQYQQYTPQPPKKKKKKGRSQLLAILLIVVLSAGAGFGGGIASVYLAASYFPELMPTVIYRSGDMTVETNETLDVGQAIYEKVEPSVVGISTTSERQVSTFFGWGSQTQIVQGIGTGFIVDEAGYVLTNSHVVNDGQTRTLTVSLTDGREVAGTVLWNDTALDLAVVKIEADNLQAAELGDSDEIAIGQYAGAIGNPMSMDFSRSFTQGVISGLNRTITVTDGAKQTTMENLIQTDATINSGNSGGPLLNAKGQVIGINSAKMTTAEGLGFAIPINTAMPIVKEIQSKGEFTKAYIGISGMDLSTYLANYPQRDFGVKQGVLIAEVTPGMGAEAAGLKSYDVITEINGEPVTGMNSLNTQLVKFRPGDTIEVTYYRDGTPRTVDVTLTVGSAA
ncbi:MAG: trypsin-like peptidase domain-containing protein [Firmicutes bacterium]|nr:trypsin-like peptidase domain-containing protein [Bacillota bacterium]